MTARGRRSRSRHISTLTSKGKWLSNQMIGHGNEHQRHSLPTRLVLSHYHCIALGIRMTLYNCKHVIPNDGTGRYRITKFDSDMNVESSYLCTTSSCDCPAGVRPSCRHRDMLPKFLHRGYVGTEWFFDFDRGGWVQGEAHFAEAGDVPEDVWNSLPDNVQVPEGSKGSDCKSDVLSRDGSNPSLHTNDSFMKRRFL